MIRDRVRLAIPDLISNSYFPAIAAVELGLLQEEGWSADVELVYPVARAMELLRAGKVDLVAGAAHAALEIFKDLHGAKFVAAVAQRTYWMLVLRADLASRRGDVSALRGCRIGAAPGPDACLRALLVDAGIDAVRDDVEIVRVPGIAASTSFGVMAASALAARTIDGFWANAMGAEVALRAGTGRLLLDVRRGDGPAASGTYTFPALVAHDDLIAAAPTLVSAVVRSLVRAQTILRREPKRATEIGRRLFPAREAELIATLIERDAPFLDAAIEPNTLEGLSRFALRSGVISAPLAMATAVANQYAPLWRAESLLR